MCDASLPHRGVLKLDARDAQTLVSSFDFLIGRLLADGIRFGILQGFQSVLLFGDGLLGFQQR